MVKIFLKNALFFSENWCKKSWKPLFREHTIFCPEIGQNWNFC